MTRGALSIAVLLFGLMVGFAGPSSAQESLKQGDVISGKLRLVQTRHPNGTRLTAYQIVSDHPLKFAEEDEFCPDYPPVTFHLVTNDKATKARLDRLLGKKIAVVAESFFCSETAWHIGDAVSFQWRFVEPARR